MTNSLKYHVFFSTYNITNDTINYPNYIINEK